MRPPMPWLRLYSEILHDPKVMRLSGEFRWYYVATLIAAHLQNDKGNLPDLTDMAIHYTVSKGRAARIIDALKAAGLIDESPDTKTLSVHGWDKRQYASDDVTARTRKWKERHGTKNGERSREQPGNGPRVRATEQSRDREENPPTPLPGMGGCDLEPFDPGPPTGPPPPTPPEHRPILDLALKRWGANNGAETASDLLRTFEPAIVRAACDAHWDRVRANLHPGRLRGICRDMAAGRWEMPREDGGSRPRAPAPAAELVITRAPADWKRPREAS